MRDRGVCFVPTLSAMSMRLSPSARPELQPLRPRMQKMLESGRRAIAIARRLGVPVVAGADTSYDEGESTPVTPKEAQKLIQFSKPD